MSYKQVTFFSFPFNGVSKGKRVNQSRKNVGKKSSYGINKRFGENSKFNWVDESSLFSVLLEHISFFFVFLCFKFSSKQDMHK